MIMLWLYYLLRLLVWFDLYTNERDIPMSFGRLREVTSDICEEDRSHGTLPLLLSLMFHIVPYCSFLVLLLFQLKVQAYVSFFSLWYWHAMACLRLIWAERCRRGDHITSGLEWWSRSSRSSTATEARIVAATCCNMPFHLVCNGLQCQPSRDRSMSQKSHCHTDLWWFDELWSTWSCFDRVLCFVDSCGLDQTGHATLGLSRSLHVRRPSWSPFQKVGQLDVEWCRTYQTHFKNKNKNIPKIPKQTTSNQLLWCFLRRTGCVWRRDAQPNGQRLTPFKIDLRIFVFILRVCTLFFFIMFIPFIPF